VVLASRHIRASRVIIPRRDAGTGSVALAWRAIAARPVATAAAVAIAWRLSVAVAGRVSSAVAWRVSVAVA
jgi:hypothetical protein